MTTIEKTVNSPSPTAPSALFHPVAAADQAAITAMRAVVEPLKGQMQGTAARIPFDSIMSSVSAPEGVTFEAETIGGVPGWWCLPRQAQSKAQSKVQPNHSESDQVLLHLHGGWFNWGSALAFRNLVGHLASRAGARAFVPDYRLAPENPFPAAVRDAEACFDGLVERGLRRIAVVGDSAGGGLALVLASSVNSRSAPDCVVPVGVVALSPVTDLTLTGDSWTTRASADPLFTHPQAVNLVRSYLGGADPHDPRASALYGDLEGLPPVRIHVGEDEVLLDDALRYVARAVSAGVDARVDVWQGMPHGFVSSVGRLVAADQAMEAIGAFLRLRLGAGS